MKVNKFTKLALGFGALAGIRSMMSPALLSESINNEPAAGLKDSNLNIFQSTLLSRILEVLSAGEVIADKLENIPDRITDEALFGRVLSGGVAGAVIFKFGRKSMIKGALIGGVAAALSAYMTYFIRKEISENTSISDKILGAAEDAVVIGGGAALGNKL